MLDTNIITKQGMDRSPRTLTRQERREQRKRTREDGREKERRDEVYPHENPGRHPKNCSYRCSYHRYHVLPVFVPAVDPRESTGTTCYRCSYGRWTLGSPPGPCRSRPAVEWLVSLCRRSTTVSFHIRTVACQVIKVIPPSSFLSVCRFKTLLCVRAKRAHVETHVRILLVHTEAF